MPIVNTGTINKTAGALDILQAFDSQASGTVNVSAGASLTFNSSNNLTQSGAFIVDGTLTVNTSNLVPNQLFTINGIGNFAHNFTFGAGTGFTGTGIVNITNGASTFNAGSILTTKLNVTGGTLNDNVGLLPGKVTIGAFGIYSGTATDVIGQTATCEQTVTVSDAESPVITCPVDQTITVNAICSSPLGSLQLVGNGWYDCRVGNGQQCSN